MHKRKSFNSGYSFFSILFVTLGRNVNILNRNDVPLEYSSEEQAISAVGLVKPRQGVFPETVSFVLVVCTVTEVSSIQYHYPCIRL